MPTKKKLTPMSIEDEKKIQKEFVKLTTKMRKYVDLHIGKLQIDMEEFLKKNKMKYDIETSMTASLEWKQVK